MKLPRLNIANQSTVCVCALLVLALVPELAFAQSGSTDGATMVQRLKDWWFGPIGLGLGLLIAIWGIIEWVRDGFKTALAIFAGCIVYFFIPYLVGALQTLAKV